MVPNANIVVSGTGATRTVKITPAGVGYAAITVSVSDGTNAESYTISYAASAAAATPAATLWHTGLSDASDAIALDDNYYITGDDELDVLNVYSRSASGLKVASFDFASALNLPNPGKPEVDLEAATRSAVNANRVYWLGSMSTGSDFLSRPNRDRLFATTITGTGAATSFSVVGYGAIKTSLLAWGDVNGYNFTASAADGVDSKTPGGFAAEGMVFGPDSTTMYIGLRAPLVPTVNRTKAVIAPILNFETWFNNGTPSGYPTYGSPIELDLGLRGIRDLMRLSNGTYIILAGDPGSASTGAIYKWTGKAADAPVLVNSSVASSLNMEGALEVNENGNLSLSKLQVISDGGTVVLYNDGTEAKQFGDLILRKFRSDNLTGLDLNLCQNPQPASFTTKSTFVYKGENAIAYTVPNVAGQTYIWSYSGTGATINGNGNSVSVNYSAAATSGILSVAANNACGASPARALPITLNSPITVNTSNYDYSFVTVGCNRVDYLDTAFTSNDIDYSTGASTANVYQLKRLFTEIAHLNPLPKYLILTGDIVMGYKTPSTPDTAELAKQLTAWKAIYESHPLSSTGIQLIAIPGNHETQDKAAGKKSFISAEQIFTRVMAPYIKGNNGPGIGGADSLTTDQSKLTYSFNFNGDHFIVLNTDPVGKNNQVPYKWLAGDIQAARANNARHIFAFGHKPAYSSPLTPKGGLDADATLPQRDSLWKYLEDNNCEAMFSAHEHLWDSIHPHAGKTWQVIAGNGGSRVEPVWVGTGKQYYGYTLVNLYTDKKVNVMGLGRNTTQSTTAGGTPYPVNEDANPTTVRNDFNICLTTNSSTSITANNSYVWNGITYAASGTYTKTLVNAAGCDSIAKLILQMVLVNQPPVITITSPSNNSTVNTSSTILLNATATDADGTITKVEFYNNGVKFGEDSTAPYSFTGNEIEPGNYVITAKATDNSGASTVSDTVRVTVTGCSGSGSISAEGFSNIPGAQVANLTASAAYPNNPDVTASLTVFEYGNNLGNNYGARVRGYICAPQTGNYTFYVAGDDQAGLYLSTDENSANKILIAYNESHVNPRAWFTYPTQKSVTIRLVKGGRYYIETLHKEATGQDHLSVAWKLPNGAFEGPIAGSRLSPFITASPARNGNFTAAMQNRSAAQQGVKGLQVKALPNPSSNYFTLITKSNSNTMLSVNVTDVQGRVVERKVNVSANGMLQVGNKLAAGIYFVEVVQGEQRQVIKLVKQ